MNTEKLTEQETEQQSQKTAKKDLNILYVLTETDGILIPCKTERQGDAYIPLNLLLSLMEKKLVQRMRIATGVASR